MLGRGLPRSIAALAACLVGLLFPAGPPFAQDGRGGGRLAAALIDEAVLVTSSFTGATLTVFGALRGSDNARTDLVVVVRGPDRPAWIGQRIRTLGLWLGQDRVRFEAAPVYFGVGTARPLGQIAPADTLSLYGLTPLSQLAPVADDRSRPDLQRFREAYVAEREKEGLYLASSSAVRLLPGGLFRADIPMPDTSPPGLYTVKVAVFRNGRQLESTLSTMVVRKVGAERALFEFARDRPLMHALAGLGLALGGGYLAAALFRRISLR
jgi:uncharacterized protein (TIGR02186 family)